MNFSKLFALLLISFSLRAADYSPAAIQPFVEQICSANEGITNFCQEKLEEGIWSFMLDWKGSANSILRGLSEPTNHIHQTEDYYWGQNYIDEPFSFLSNLAISAVGVYHKNPEIQIAAIFSALSHAIPQELIHHADFLGIFIFATVASYKLYHAVPKEKLLEKMEYLLKDRRIKRALAAAFLGGAFDLVNRKGLEGEFGALPHFI